VPQATANERQLPPLDDTFNFQELAWSTAKSACIQQWCMPTLSLAVRALGRTRRFCLLVSVLCSCGELRMCLHVSSRDVVMLQDSCLDWKGFVSELHMLVVVSLAPSV